MEVRYCFTCLLEFVFDTYMLSRGKCCFGISLCNFPSPSGLTRDGTAGSVSQDQTLRCKRGQGKEKKNSVQLTTSNIYPVDPCSIESADHR